jgi:dTMP kinase
METPGAEADNAETAAVFITFEGIEAAGKSTLIEALADDLRRTGASVLITREPGGTPLGDAIRRLFIDPATAIDPLAEALLINASRSQLVADVIGPALRAGHDVLCDRFFDATIAYQGYGRGLDVEVLLEVSLIATRRIAPDLTFLLDLPAAVSAGRVRARGGADRLEREDEAFHGRVREGYRALAGRFPRRFVVLDATRPPAEVLASARGILAERRAAAAAQP